MPRYNILSSFTNYFQPFALFPPIKDLSCYCYVANVIRPRQIIGNFVLTCEDL